MTLDDDSILSAYLDGQLGPEEQQAVESALFADPRFAEELRGLAMMRDLVAALPREAPADVTSRVMRRVRRRAMHGPSGWVIAWGPVRAAGLAAIAAGVLTVLALPWLLQVGRHEAPGRRLPALAQDASGPAKVRPVSERLWPPFSTHGPRDGTHEPHGSGGPRPVEVGPAGVEGSEKGELMHVREYLDNPQLRRVFLVTERKDGLAAQRVASIVEQTTRFNFYKITVSQGIVIDARHPDQATVFALVVGPRELDDLRHRLSIALDDRVEESPVEPEIVTQLADIGHVEACPPSPAAEMAIPRDALALRSGDDAGAVEAPEAPRVEHPKEKQPDPPTLAQERSSPRAEVEAATRASGPRAEPRAHEDVILAGHAARGGPAPAGEADPVVVLVWVSRPRPG